MINNYLTMQKGNGLAKPPADATAGMSIIQDGSAKIVVRVKHNSAAYDAGIQPGDRIEAVNNKPIATLDMFELREVLTHEPGKLVNLDLNRRNQVVSVALRLAELDVTR
ncbi:MAG: PDZ domain-containing protein [Planctomycetales bacterium]|nr:PDZ domain-containing protein [Planctomycetales bacterium]